MLYYSLNHQSPKINFAEAAVKGQAPDKGLYFPEYIPTLPKEFINHIKSYSKEEIGFTIMKPYVAESIDNNTLQQIINETINFNFPLVKISENIASLELFHGPTLAFKDIGARFMSRCLGYFNRNNNKEITVLVATSGDTGGAVANGFLGVDGVNVVILYPSKKVSRVQELQLTTLGKNITALEVEGTFDDCQTMVKQAFSDNDLNKKLSLTSANSINVARWLPQQLYYFFAYQQWIENEAPIICVPSGNFGNICAGIVAHISGLPANHFIAACNANDVVPNYLQTEQYQPKAAVATISNAMDVGNPSNFIRIMQLFNHQFNQLKNKLSSVSVTDSNTKKTIHSIYKKYKYILDPHGAVAYKALEDYLKNKNEKGFILGTAHPVKFPETVEEVINQKIDIPKDVERLFNLKKESILMQADFKNLKEYLISK
ncbi:MAG: threonine synthase [Bacteroidetes bacterium]|nr:threonine synthase [Bacteroidota bacterium]MBS1649629.1 threonine synthase [Bacteroidota bacterium]